MSPNPFKFKGNLVTRIWLAGGMLLAIVLAIYLIFAFALQNMQQDLQQKSSSHLQTLTNNAEISRQVLALISRIEKLKQAHHADSKTLINNSVASDEMLQSILTLSSDPDMSAALGKFAANTNRLLGNILSLNQILREKDKLDASLSVELERSNMRINHNWLLSHRHLSNLLNSTTPATINSNAQQAENSLLAMKKEIRKAQDQNTLAKIDADKLQKQSSQYRRLIKKLKVNLLLEWQLTQDLEHSRSQLLGITKRLEDKAQADALTLENEFEQLTQKLKYSSLIFTALTICFGFILVNRFIRRHIRVPMAHIVKGIEQLEANKTSPQVELNRQDEWHKIEVAFNQMSQRLLESYQQLHSEQQKFDYLAHHDPLTGLANRLSIQHRLDETISNAQQTQSQFTLMYMDLDQFKRVNDSLGHSVGDALLQGVAQRIETTLEKTGIGARLGGDEFLVILPEVADFEEASLIADNINQSLAQPFDLDEQEIFITNSIGICFYPQDGNNAETLIRNADTALYQAKRAGRNCSVRYEHKMTSHAHQLIDQNSGIRRALENDELRLHYQAKYDLVSGNIIGAEALIRWQHPDIGLLSPAKFLPIAEETGLITEIDDWVFKKMCQQLVSWQDAGLDIDTMRFSCNSSARRFLRGDLPDMLKQVLKETGANPAWLELEITERDIMTKLDACCSVMKEILAMDIELAIDDFGTGHSSLNYLKHLPATTLKIDKSFVDEMCDTSANLAIVQSIITLADNLGMKTVAEGIETAQQARQLISLGCHSGQGYHYSHPLSCEEFFQLVTADEQELASSAVH